MKKYFIVFIIVVTYPLGIYAQGKDSLESTKKAITEQHYEVQRIDSLQKEISRLVGQIAKYKQTVDTLNSQLYDYEQTIKDQNKKIKKLNHYLLFADTIVARLSNDCLRKKYDLANVNQAIRNFEQMYSSELKNKFGRLKYLLNEYEIYTQELVSILLEAQNDKSLGNPFTGQKQAQSYIDKIKNTRYYQDVYNDDWTIPYLNNLIDKCFETIKSFNPKESKELHLIELMN
ncbi:hypothetical protein [Xylanibacter ruminicola]|uniref:Uncharacterized protein n=1 Tax=Xylanibacter ruminicola TaxID=839 RepID=A0A1M6VGL2_XYLRU|nr:hypothetical protein [Xylanibacter ruminicola]SHK80599.1 hypothetical protein SAMN05216463_112112 [Xylanibacter ruminicola]